MSEQDYPLLYSLDSQKKLKDLSDDEILRLNEEIRRFLIDRVCENGGHLASNLGMVELSVALERVFNTPHDHIIFDVGHQSYVHKMLTGRLSRMDTLRRGGGISGFPKRSESEHDCFGTGHASTSLSAALGFAEADRLSGSDAYTVAVVGDGAFTGGMIHEALNNCENNLRLVIILNENEMSISKNIGRFANTLSRLRVKKGYFRFKRRLRKAIRKIPLVGERLFLSVRDMKKRWKNNMYGSNLFEDLGLYYLGPVDGNDYETVEKLLTEAKQLDESVVIHLKTKKGKGFPAAEDFPAQYHGMPPASRAETHGNTFSVTMGEYLARAARENQKVCAITAAMTEGCGLTTFRKEYPNRFFDVGIAEEHAVTFAAGLAANGYRPVVAIYSTFLQRGYDQMIHDVALQSLPVVFCIDRAGFNACDGPTHNGVFDVSFISQIPNITLYAPVTCRGLERSLEAALASDLPVAIRYPSGWENEKIVNAFYRDGEPSSIGIRLSKNLEYAASADVVLVTHGRIAAEALAAEKMLDDMGKRAVTVLCEYICPYDALSQEVAAVLPQGACRVVFVEEEIRAGGFGMMLSDRLSRLPAMRGKTAAIVAADNGFEGLQEGKTLYESVGVSAADIVGASLGDVD